MASPNFQPLKDFILVLPDPKQKMEGSIHIPDSVGTPGHKAGRSEDCFVGTVVAVGPGDRHKPWESMKCRDCGKKPVHNADRRLWLCGCSPYKSMSKEGVEFWNAGRHVMDTKVGDRVIYPRRPSAPGVSEELVMIDGVGYVMFAEEQFALGILEA